MRLTNSLAASLALAALLLAACNPQDSSTPAANANAARPAGAATPQQQASATPAPADGVRRMTIQEARAAADAGRAIIYDVRTKEAFATGHIKGARLAPHDEVERHLSEFPKDKLIITYCA